MNSGCKFQVEECAGTMISFDNDADIKIMLGVQDVKIYSDYNEKTGELENKFSISGVNISEWKYLYLTFTLAKSVSNGTECIRYIKLTMHSEEYDIQLDEHNLQNFLKWAKLMKRCVQSKIINGICVPVVIN